VSEVAGYLVGRLVFPVLFVMLVVGGIYYLIRRPRVTFLRAVTRWWVMLLGVILVLLSLLGQAVG
jgi:hypothetical protein